MSITRTLVTPLVGAAAAGAVLYGAGNSLALRTHQVTHTLHNSNRSLRRLAEVDDTQDLLKQLDIAPETTVLAGEVHDAKKKVDDILPSAYQRPLQPTLTEQVKARWNEYLITFSHVLSETDADKIVNGLTDATTKVYNFATGQKPIASLTGKADEFASTLRASAPNAPTLAAATLRTPIPPIRDPRLDSPNTYYLGQGASLR